MDTIGTPNATNPLISLYRSTYFSFKIPFIVSTDASATQIGGILIQVQNGMERVAAYWSRQLHKAERNYSTVEREALAVVLKNFTHTCMDLALPSSLIIITH